MSVLVIVPPEEMPVTVAEVKIQLGITDTSKDVLLESLIEAATGQIDGPDGLLGRALITQTPRIPSLGVFMWRCSTAMPNRSEHCFGQIR